MNALDNSSITAREIMSHIIAQASSVLTPVVCSIYDMTVEFHPVFDTTPRRKPYAKWYKYGDILARVQKTLPFPEDFERDLFLDAPIIAWSTDGKIFVFTVEINDKYYTTALNNTLCGANYEIHLPIRKRLKQ